VRHAGDRFATGGMLDMVRPGITGQLVPVADTAALRDAIRAMVRDEDARRAMSANCRRIAVEEYSIEAQRAGLREPLRIAPRLTAVVFKWGWCGRRRTCSKDAAARTRTRKVAR
jgi:hypothetical protein